MAPKRDLLDILSGFFPPKFAKAVIENLKLWQCNTKNIKRLVFNLKHWEFKNVSAKGFESAEVSGGGVSGDSVFSYTLESKSFEGLYIIGEMLDVVGDRGGYNLAFAWASAKVCADSIMKQKRNGV